MKNPKVENAFNAMKALGIASATVKPVLKQLLKMYDKNWEFIEAENYRALVDAIFEFEEEKEDKVHPLYYSIFPMYLTFVIHIGFLSVVHKSFRYVLFCNECFFIES